MGIERGGDAEYEEFEPSYEEKAENREGKRHYREKSALFQRNQQKKCPDR